MPGLGQLENWVGQDLSGCEPSPGWCSTHNPKDFAEGRIPCYLLFILPSFLLLSAPLERRRRVLSVMFQLSAAAVEQLNNSAGHKSNPKLGSFTVTVLL